MKLEFGLDNVSVTEFGVGRDDGNGQTFVAVPVDADVQAALARDGAGDVGRDAKDEDGPTKYEPSEKHGSTEYLYLPRRRRPGCVDPRAARVSTTRHRYRGAVRTRRRVLLLRSLD